MFISTLVAIRFINHSLPTDEHNAFPSTCGKPFGIRCWVDYFAECSGFSPSRIGGPWWTKGLSWPYTFWNFHWHFHRPKYKAVLRYPGRVVKVNGPLFVHKRCENMEASSVVHVNIPMYHDHRSNKIPTMVVPCKRYTSRRRAGIREFQ